MEGRILDALGAPLDGLPAPRVTEMWPLDGTVPHPMEREADPRAVADGDCACWMEC